MIPVVMNFSEFDFPLIKKDFSVPNYLSNVNIKKVERTLRFSIKKCYYYLGAKFEYGLTNFRFKFHNGVLSIFSFSDHDFLYELFLLDGIIRCADDTIDNLNEESGKLSREQLDRAISKMIELNKSTAPVAELFYKESELLYEENMIEPELKIKDLINIRPCDFFVIANKIMDKYGYSLSNDDYKYAKTFFMEFQILRDLLDDMMAVDEDLSNKNYNSIIVAKHSGLKPVFFKQVVIEKLDLLRVATNHIVDKSRMDFFLELIIMWENYCNTIFYPLLNAYYGDIKEFRKTFFMIKQY